MKKKTSFTKSYDIKQMKLSPIDNLVYATLHIYRNNKTFKCNPTMNQLSEKLNVSQDTIKRSIDKLEELEYIKIEQTKKGNKTNNYYYLPDITNFTKIPIAFIDNTEYDAKIKGFTIAFRNLFFSDSLNCKYSNSEIAERLNISKRTTDKYIKQMMELNLITHTENTYNLNDNIVNWRLTQLEKDVEDIKEDKADKAVVTELKNELEQMHEEMKLLKAMLYKQMKGTTKKNNKTEIVIL